MSYSIYIGETAVDPDDRRRKYVAALTLPEAPQFPGDDMTGQSNGRHPGYAAWDDFVRATGLHPLFHDPKIGLMRDHPGIKRLTKAHHDVVIAAREAWEWAHPGAVPGFAEDGRLNYNLARLIWLDWWMGWALQHCEGPAIYNS